MKVKSWSIDGTVRVSKLTAELASAVAYGNRCLTPLQVVEYLEAGLVVWTGEHDMHYGVSDDD